MNIVMCLRLIMKNFEDNSLPKPFVSLSIIILVYKESGLRESNNHLYLQVKIKLRLHKGFKPGFNGIYDFKKEVYSCQLTA